MQFTNF